jgi:predicted nucleic acid-binding protein
MLGAYPDRVLGLDVGAALHARRLSRHARETGIEVGFADLTIGCIACAHGLVVATRNPKHFARMGVTALDPFAA